MYVCIVCHNNKGGCAATSNINKHDCMPLMNFEGVSMHQYSYAPCQYSSVQIMCRWNSWSPNLVYVLSHAPMCNPGLQWNL